MSSFWTRRRQAVAAEARREVEAEQQAVAQAHEAELEAKTDEELLAELGLPEPETLTGGEELRAFLAADLPQRLKRRALRTLWRSNPVLACLDGLNDYDEDFTGVGVTPRAVQTLYQVGRGFAQQIEQVAEAVEDEAAEDEIAEIAAEASSVRVTEAEPAAPIGHNSEAMGLADAPEELEAEPLPPRFRRMQFRFEAPTQDMTAKETTA
ncbi:DUF3306 domain-containing protein [Pseudooceanicola nanhaiensis]|uniref:DUF3306 domain-containing protein n=1 Tax=Pseudooceanicola nanhaiensis TaxID=375761 RepID=UPI001CD26DC8|nr:DUF3306 domain-containing protein [Pseudooceanicola nanhaiensis]MCA0922472.1 DUF3306 domain-containing protein [Pseudooceanicola nanhaiensis]